MFLGIFLFCLRFSVFVQFKFHIITFCKSCVYATHTINLYFSDFFYEHWISKHYSINLSLSSLVNGSVEGIFYYKKLQKETFTAARGNKNGGIYFYITTENKNEVKWIEVKKSCLVGCYPDSCLFLLGKLIILLEIMYFSVLTVWQRWRNVGAV